MTEPTLRERRANARGQAKAARERGEVDWFVPMLEEAVSYGFTKKEGSMTLRERARKARYALEEKLVLESSMLEGGVIQHMAVEVERAYISGSLDTMRECTKLVCWRCEGGEEVKPPDPRGDYYHYYDDPCPASAIQAAIALAEAEREEK